MIEYISPQSSSAIFLHENEYKNENESFPIINGIPRFVELDNYASAFGYQWNIYTKTQLDSHTGYNLSKERLERCLGHDLSKLNGLNVLEVGCGAGRFTELLVKSGALVHCIDLSNAVEANQRNIGNAPNYKIAQANVYHLPYPKENFDYVICLGVVQHTPSSEKTIKALWQMVKPGGNLIIDHYKWGWGKYANTTELFRFFLKRMSPQNSKKIVDKIVDFAFPIYWYTKEKSQIPFYLRFVPFLLYRFFPINFYYHYLGNEKSREFYYEWCKLDTYDFWTDYYKHYKTKKEIETILKSLPSATEIYAAEAGNGVEAKCRKNR